MKRATAVIGAGFGDEGKGLMTDYLVRQGDPSRTIVVRFNGGAQAGHTVVEPGGRRHVFHHHGAGTFAGAKTFLSADFLVNPVLWRMESAELANKVPFLRTLLVDPRARVTTPFDMMNNQILEEARGDQRHGSCGSGVHATMVRNVTIPLVAEDLMAHDLVDKVAQVRKFYGAADPDDRVLLRFVHDCRIMAQSVGFAMSDYLRHPQEDLVFEGAQGLLLDQDRKDFFPHVTHSKTGLTNVVRLCSEAGVDDLRAVFVTRTYATRHGAGPLPGEDPAMSYPDDTNVENKWQGKLRFAPLDHDLVGRAICDDLISVDPITTGVRVGPVVAFTHCDQFTRISPIASFRTAYLCDGPTHADVVDASTLSGAVA